MKTFDGHELKVGDSVRLGDEIFGTVVADIGNGVFTDKFPELVWRHMGSGILIESEQIGLVHYEIPDEDLTLTRTRDLDN